MHIEKMIVEQDLNASMDGNILSKITWTLPKYLF